MAAEIQDVLAELKKLGVDGVALKKTEDGCITYGVKWRDGAMRVGVLMGPEISHATDCAKIIAANVT